MDWRERKTAIKVAFIGGSAAIIAALIAILPSVFSKDDPIIRRKAYDSLSVYIGEIKKAPDRFVRIIPNEYTERIKSGRDSMTVEGELIELGHMLIKTDCHILGALLDEAFPRPEGDDWQKVLTKPYRKYYSPFLKDVIAAHKKGLLKLQRENYIKLVHPAIAELDSTRLQLRKKL